MCTGFSRLKRLFLLLALALAGDCSVFLDTVVAAGFDKKLWAQIRQPGGGKAETIGFYSAGCLQGGQTLPLTGPGFQVMRVIRNRYHGHPNLIRFIQQLGRYAATQQARLLIGDLSQPRGGPMSYGHSSHQTGLDADIWLQHIAANQQLPVKETETRPFVSVVDVPGGRILPERWSGLYRNILQIAAESPEVERVFVNPVIKQTLCRNPDNHSWLRKIRPWWGHDAHIHIRLACPTGNSQCKPQKPPPPGSGCDHWLDQWVEDQKLPPRKQKKSRKKALVLPTACYQLLDNH